VDTNKIHDGQPDQTADQDTQGAEWELKRTENMARSVGGAKTSPSLSGGKTTKIGDSANQPVATISTKTGKTSKK
jgi:hypothetical protein